jgi:signal transduction histidine kinase
MLGQLDVALRRPREAEENRDTLTVVRGHVTQMRSIVESLLFLARANSDAALPGLGEVDLGAWLTAHLEGWRDHARARDLRVEIASNRPVMARVHAGLLSQLLDNLLDNAFKYSRPQSTVTVRLDRERSRIALSVSDQGVGIAPDELSRIFEPFFRAPHTRHFSSGVGLGLAVARRIAESFGGSLDASSEPGHGSRFVVHLPDSAAPMPASRAETTLEVHCESEAAGALSTDVGRSDAQVLAR